VCWFQPWQLYYIVVGAFNTNGILRSRPALAVLAGGDKRASPHIYRILSVHTSVNHFLDVWWSFGKTPSPRGAMGLNLATPDMVVNG
jgi:hypothetical protein